MIYGSRTGYILAAAIERMNHHFDEWKEIDRTSAQLRGLRNFIIRDWRNVYKIHHEVVEEM